MSAIDDLFTTLRAEGRTAFIPFVTAGDPDLDFTRALLLALVKHGSHLCELGVPYSDPIADGPVIQASYTRALRHGTRLTDILEMVAGLSPELGAPLVTMVSYAIVYRVGVTRFIADARAAGVAGAIVPDLPAEEAAELARQCRAADFSLIQLVTPTSTRERALRIAETSSGFLYYVSVAGITGERTELPPELVDNVAWLRERTALPICIGFGISLPEHARRLAAVADGIIVGSAIVRQLAAADATPRAQLLTAIGDYVRSMVAATQDASPDISAT